MFYVLNWITGIGTELDNKSFFQVCMTSTSLHVSCKAEKRHLITYIKRSESNQRQLIPPFALREAYKGLT